MSLILYQVDSFCSEPFSGNPAGVCILDKPLSSLEMQNIATEMALSETSFLYRDGDNYHLRWFTPVAEVDLCGHATLAAAHILWETGVEARSEELSFRTASGILKAVPAKTKGTVLDFPSEPAETIEISDILKSTVDRPVVNAARNRLDYLIELESESEVAECDPNIPAILKLGSRGLIITARGTATDFVSRYFAPAYGIDEDPVTGSTHCALGPYWAERLGKTALTAAQLSKRGGTLGVKVRDKRVSSDGRCSDRHEN